MPERHAAHVEGVADADAELAGEIRAQDGDRGSLVRRSQQAALARVDPEPIEPLVRAGHRADDELRDAEPGGLDDPRTGICTCGSTAPTPSRPRIWSATPTSIGHEADAEAAGRAVADDDLADVVVAAARDERVDLVGHRAEDDERPDADDDPEDRERRPQLPAAEVAQEPHGVAPAGASLTAAAVRGSSTTTDLSVDRGRRARRGRRPNPGSRGTWPIAARAPRLPRRGPARRVGHPSARLSCPAAPAGSATTRAPSRPSRSWPS